MKKRNIIWPLAIVAVLGSPSTTAVKLSFGFKINLFAVSCVNLPSSGERYQTRARWHLSAPIYLNGRLTRPE